MWIIEVDRIADTTKSEGTNANAKGVHSRKYDPAVKLAHRFRMLDDDGEVYYEGRSDDDSSFAPLDHFGGPNAGATSIQYFENGKGGGWKTL